MNRTAPLRILNVTWSFFPAMGGVPTHVYEVTKRLAAMGVDITVLCTDPGQTLPPEERVNGVRVLRVPAWPANKDYFLAPGIYHTIVKGDWDLIHCQGYHTLVPPTAMLAALQRKIPYIVTFHSGGHSDPLRNRLRPFQWAVLRPLLRRAQRLVAVSKFEAEFFQEQLKFPPECFAVIPNGSQLPTTSDIPIGNGNGKLLVSIGRLERYKGHQRVIEALPKVLEQFPDARLRIVGTGPYESALQEIVREKGMRDFVEIGPIPPEDRQGMAVTLKKAALVVLMSEYEAHPITVMEALAMHRPVLVADTSGLREIARQGLAQAIPLESSSDQIAAAINEQLRHPIIPANVELPSWERCASSLLAVYQEVVQAR